MQPTGRINAVTIREGDISNLKSGGDSVANIEILREDLSPHARADLAITSPKLASQDVIRLAAPQGITRFHDEYGVAAVRNVEVGRSLRAATLSHSRSA